MSLYLAPSPIPSPMRSPHDFNHATSPTAAAHSHKHAHVSPATKKRGLTKTKPARVGPWPGRRPGGCGGGTGPNPHRGGCFQHLPRPGLRRGMTCAGHTKEPPRARPTPGPHDALHAAGEVRFWVGAPKCLWWPCRGGPGGDDSTPRQLKGYYGRDSPRWPGHVGPDRDGTVNHGHCFCGRVWGPNFNDTAGAEFQ